MLAVCTADYGLLSDLYAVCHKCTCDDCTVFYDCTGHQHAVDDLSACADLDIREQDGILYAACYDTALCRSRQRTEFRPATTQPCVI